MSATVERLPDGLTVGQIFMCLVEDVDGAEGEQLAGCQDFAGLLDLIPELDALSDNDRRACAGITAVMIFATDLDAGLAVLARADQVEREGLGKSPLDDRAGSAAGLRQIAALLAWPDDDGRS